MNKKKSFKTLMVSMNHIHLIFQNQEKYIFDI